MATEEKYVCSLPDSVLKKAMSELNEDPNTRLLEIKNLRQRLEKYPGLNGRTDPKFLLRFLRARKFDQELSFKLLLNYYTTRRDDQEVFSDLRPFCVRHVFESGYTTPLGVRDKQGAAIILEKPGKWDYGRFSELDLIKADCITIHKVIEDEITQVNGITLVIDYKGFTLSHLAHTSPSFARRLCRLWQDVFPARLRAVHIVNEPATYGNIFALFKPFLKQKLLDRIFFHGPRHEELLDHIDEQNLPEAYGGKMTDVSDTTWCDVILQYDKQFEEDAKFGLLDMTVSSALDADSESLGGVAQSSLVGTFKKLSVD
ncbi:alpha-tocopherol transfer protein-like [Biomphalaria glabrata]|uniref:Alpha-tocopherol transfer protein-like n=1 Tax=Biomphalaria glabrata TaxID=6526 RepID=A0A9W2Z7C7_BIOGL|nr:alpha-tocopherol transfer protein-like [Biomphalaria glabrata]XP_055870868.1 alpha-tocopherol transfer protein-like [Biomphalaria glabrata]